LPSKLELTTQRAELFYVELLLGGGPPVITVATEVVLRTRVSPEAAISVTNHRPNRSVVASLS
jgi:hypothetical protein